jgi:hypothetical protein
LTEGRHDFGGVAEGGENYRHYPDGPKNYQEAAQIHNGIIAL